LALVRAAGDKLRRRCISWRLLPRMRPEKPAYPAADAAGAGYRRGDPGWTAAGADDAGAPDATVSGALVCTEIGTSAPRLNLVEKAVEVLFLMGLLEKLDAHFI
jgi:hypothetical protein